MENLFGENEGEVNPALPAMAALLSALALIIADIDFSREGISILDRLDKDLDNTSETFPTLLVEQEQKLNEYRQAFRNSVEQAKEGLSVLNAEELSAFKSLVEVAGEYIPTPRPSDAVDEGATARAVLVLAASLSLAINRLPVNKGPFVSLLEHFLQDGIREYNATQPEKDWLLGILAALRF